MMNQLNVEDTNEAGVIVATSEVEIEDHLRMINHAPHHRQRQQHPHRRETRDSHNSKEPGSNNQVYQRLGI